MNNSTPNLGIAFSDNVSVEVGVVRGSESNGMVNLFLNLFSTSTQWASVALLYKKDALDEWRSDMAIISSNSRFVNGNEMCGLPCSLNGIQSQLTWNYAANEVAMGSRCIIKAMVVPSVGIMSQMGDYSVIETVVNGDNRVIGNFIEGNLVGFTSLGYAIVLSGSTISLFDVDTKTVQASKTLSDAPSHAIGIPNGNIIIIDENALITEVDYLLTSIRTFNATAIAQTNSSLAYSVAGTLLVAGAGSNLVSELSWGGSDYGTPLWSYSNGLNNPMGVCYGDGLNTIVICSTENNEVIIVNRSILPQSVTTISSITMEGQSVPLNSPFRCLVSDGIIFVCEASGKTEVFGETAATHPAMIRAGFGGTGYNTLSQYAGMCFVPIVRSIR
jgi:hypothetical protein